MEKKQRENETRRLHKTQRTMLCGSICFKLTLLPLCLSFSATDFFMQLLAHRTGLAEWQNGIFQMAA